jgi:hypothetical protein
MRKRASGTVLSLFLLLGAGGWRVSAADAVNSIICDNGVVEIGDLALTVQDKCGEPDKKEGKFWGYEFGPSTPAYTLEFDENGKVVRILEDQWGS